MQKKESDYRLKPADILMVFGAHNLSNLFQSGTFSTTPGKVIVHDDWNPFSRRFDADIAALVMEEEIPYTKFIRPCCLLQTELKGNEGYVAGWGQSEDNTKIHETVSKHTKTPIVSLGTCFSETTGLGLIGSDRMICGGLKEGMSGPCRGDSGKFQVYLNRVN